MKLNISKVIKKTQFPLIIILLIVALFLGQAIYKQRSMPSPPKPASQHVSSYSPKLMPSDLTREEKDVLTPPSASASQEEKDKHDALAAKLSKESETLDIANCRPNPLVLRIKINQNLKIKNNENIDHKLIFDDTHQYKILKNSTTTVETDFGHGAGLYGYVCEGVGLTGFILVIP